MIKADCDFYSKASVSTLGNRDNNNNGRNRLLRDSYEPNFLEDTSKQCIYNE